MEIDICEINDLGVFIKNKFTKVGYEDVVRHTEKRAHTQIVHLVFADPKANLEKPKELFFLPTLDGELVTCES